MTTGRLAGLWVRGVPLCSEVLVAQVASVAKRVFLAAPLVLVGALAAGRLTGLGVDRVLAGALRALLFLAALARLLALVLRTPMTATP
ncbi:hypothetical protein [Streptomyces sp. NPDC058612]|uniref:hypothetical protein n=1 Tax=Streptomyces sp. NPDC058612 TaxID=3346555 RepID=UPI00364CD4D7